MKKHLFMIFAVLLVAFVIMGCSTNKTVTYKIDKRTVLTGKLITPKEFPYKVQSGILITGLEGEYVIESHNNELDKKLFNSKLVDAWNADADIYWWSRIINIIDYLVYIIHISNNSFSINKEQSRLYKTIEISKLVWLG